MVQQRWRVVLTVMPGSVTEEIRGFAKKVCGTEDVEYVPIEPLEDGAQRECFDNVDRAVSVRGGRKIYGWILWEMPNVLLEAEFHAVWQDEGGQLIDVTPQRDHDERVLFVRDPSRKFDGEPVDNVRLALDDHPLVAEFIDRGRRKYELLREFKGTGYVSIPREEYERRFPKEQEFAPAFMAYALGKRGRNDPCYCGSGLKVKKCCGEFRGKVPGREGTEP